jgi:hypothetical protein
MSGPRSRSSSLRVWLLLKERCRDCRDVLRDWIRVVQVERVDILSRSLRSWSQKRGSIGCVIPLSVVSCEVRVLGSTRWSSDMVCECEMVAREGRKSGMSRLTLFRCEVENQVWKEGDESRKSPRSVRWFSLLCLIASSRVLRSSADVPGRQNLKVERWGQDCFNRSDRTEMNSVVDFPSRSPVLSTP